jgi:hypothetical protein
MRGLSTYLERRGGEISSILVIGCELMTFRRLDRKIVTHRAEDGSGVGSAIIAGTLFCPLELLDPS